MASGMSTIMRRLDALERALGDGDGEDFGPTTLLVFTRYWRSGSGSSAGDGDEHERDDQFGERRERMLIDAATAAVRQEARERREHLGHVTATVNGRGEVELLGVPWRPVGKELAWMQGLFPKRS